MVGLEVLQGARRQASPHPGPRPELHGGSGRVCSSPEPPGHGFQANPGGAQFPLPQTADTCCLSAEHCQD